MHLTGWVKNTRAGVEIKAFGREDAIDKLITWCHTGPEKATVSAVNVSDIAPEHFDTFSVIR